MRELDWPAFFLGLKRANYTYLPLLFIWSSLSYFLRAQRWRVLLIVEKRIPPLNVFWATMIGYLGNTLLPVRAGELLRAAYVGNQNEMAIPFALATGLVERAVDLLILIVIGSVSLSIAGIVSSPIKSALISMSVFGFSGLAVILFSPRLKKQLTWMAQALPLLTSSTKEKISAVLDQFLRGFEALHHPGGAGTFTFLTLLIWTMDALGVTFLARTLHLEILLIQAFLLLAALGLSSAIPSTPGYIGVYQFVAMIVLQPFGFSSASSLTLILFSQIMNFLTVTLWGGIALTRSKTLNRTDIK